MHPIPFPSLLLLVGAAFFGGFVDAIAGGGGLVTVPALLAAGLSPHQALGTNKGQSFFGSFAAAVRYGRAGLVDRRSARVNFPTAFVGSLAGAALVLVVRPDILRPVVLALIVFAALLVAILRPRPAPHGVRRHARLIAATIALVIGTYDGFFGPGAGTFYIAAFVGILGVGFVQASADAKIANFASNVAAAAIFAAKGTILWHLALAMAGANFAGGFLGAHVAVRRGDPMVRWVAVLVAIAFAIKVARDLYAG